MLITIIALVGVFFLARFLLTRYAGTGSLASIVATAIVIAFAFGFADHALIFPAAAPASTPIAVVATPPPQASPGAKLPGTMVVPSTHALTPAQVAALLPAGKPISYSVIESLGGTGAGANQFTTGANVMVHGWAGDPASKVAAHGLLVIVDGKRRTDASPSYGKSRPDVAAAFNTAGMLRSGYDIPLSTVGLMPGTHTLQIAVLRPDNRTFVIVTPTPTAFTIN